MWNTIEQFWYIQIHTWGTTMNNTFLVFYSPKVLSRTLIYWNRFSHSNVMFYLEYHCTAVSEVSRGKKWSVNRFQTPKVQETEYTYSSANFRNYEKKKKNWVILQNLHTLVLRWCSEMNIGETWSFSLPGTWSKVTSSKKNRRWYFRQRSWFALARSLFHKQRVDDQKSINKFGSSCNILSRRAQMSTEICIKLFTRTRI